MAVNLRQNPDGSCSLINELDGKEVARFGGVTSANTSSASASSAGVQTYRAQKWAVMPLLATAGVGAALASFQNKEENGADIYVTDYLLDIQTGSAASCTCKVDVGNLATSSGTTVITALDLSNVLLASAGWDGTAGGKPRVKMTANQYLNCIMVSGSATGLVGRAVVGYIVA